MPAKDNPYAEDDTPENLSVLAKNIRTNGLISPLAVNKIFPDEYRLISGERRYKATARSQKMTIRSGKHTIDLTYSQVDEAIRKAIRKDTWVSADTAETIIIEKYST